MFLERLTARDRKLVLQAARQVRISPREVLQHEGHEASRLCLLITGRVAVYRLADTGDELFLAWGAPGDTFGLPTILNAPARYLVTVEAAQTGSILTWDVSSSHALVLRCPSLSRALLSVAANNVARLIDVLTMHTFQTAQQRIGRVLVESARQLGRDGHDGIELDLTNEQIAVAAHVSLFTASRNLSKWHNLGVLKKRRGKIVLSSLSSFERSLRANPADVEVPDQKR